LFNNLVNIAAAHASNGVCIALRNKALGMVIATYPTFGYSQKSLPEKLGYKPELSIVFIALPHSLEELPDTVDFAKVARRQDWSRPIGPNHFDMMHAFSSSRAEIAAGLPKLLRYLNPRGAIWLSWPKKTAKVQTDLTEDVVRSEALKLGLVDIKVAAIDTTWSGLKLVQRLVSA